MVSKAKPQPATESTTVLVLSGEVTVGALSALQGEFLQALDSTSPVRLHALDLSYIDAAGLQFLWSFRRECELRGRELHIVPPGDSVLRDAERLGMRNVFSTNGALQGS